MILTDHQQDVFDDIIKKYNDFNDFGQCFICSITGPAGTGKTVLTTELINYFIKNSQEVTCTTPTHKSLAVLNKMIKDNKLNRLKIKSQTIHSYLGLKLQYEEDKVKLAIDSLMNVKDVDKTNILFIDESSMISAELYKFIQEAIKKKSGRLKAVIFIGDEYQLLPVEGKQNPVYSTVGNKMQLTEVVRQALDSGILRYATNIRKEIQNKTYSMNSILDIPKSDDIIIYNKETDLIKDFCLETDKDKIMSSFTNVKTDYYNAFARQYEFRNLEVIPEFIEGENLIMQSSYQDLKNGEEVYVTLLDKRYNKELDVYYWSFNPNDYDFEVHIIAKESINTFNNKLNEIANKAKTLKRDKYFKECSDMWDLFWKIKNQFAEVKHTYSSTIHKLQGSTYNNVYLNLPEIFTNCRNKEDLFRLVYVAVTRARSNLIVFRDR